MNRIEFLDNAFKNVNIYLSKLQLNQFINYYGLLINRNKVVNLTAITDYNDVVVKHFIDSVSLNRVMDLSSSLNIIDVGTGAGFPGVPLKIVYAHLNIVLLDSLNKRVKFLNDVINSLELNNNEIDNDRIYDFKLNNKEIEDNGNNRLNNSVSNENDYEKGSIVAIHGRAEDFGQMDIYREKFDICVSRAVANLSTLSEYCLPLVKVGGSFISYKADNVKEEVSQAENAVKVMGGKIDRVESFTLYDTDINRNLIKIDKTKRTPKKYPRTAGTPKRNPLNK